MSINISAAGKEPTKNEAKENPPHYCGLRFGREPFHDTGRIQYCLRPGEFDAWRAGQLSDCEVDRIVGRRAKQNGGRK